MITVLKTIATMLALFFVPGFAWSLVLFAGKKIGVLERIAVAIGLSIALSVLFVLGANIVLDVKINAVNAAVTVLVITVIPLAWYFIAAYVKKKRNNDSRVRKN